VERKRSPGRPKKGEEAVQDEGTRRMLKELRSMNRRLKGIQGMLGGGGGNGPMRVEIAKYFYPIEGLPGSQAIEVEVNNLVNRYAAEGWRPIHVSSQPGHLDAGAGRMPGEVILIVWGLGY